jgi:hypothetical protein
MLLLKKKRTFQEVLAGSFMPLVVLPASGFNEISYFTGVGGVVGRVLRTRASVICE